MKHIYKNTRWDSGVVRPIGLMITIMAICIGFLAWVLKNYHDEQEIAKFRVPPLTESVR